MFENWKTPVPLNLFYGKTAFYQLIFEIYKELDKGHISVLQPDIAAMAQRYLDSAYIQDVRIQDLANTLNVSYSHLHRIFSKQTGKSPQEYLMDKRINACKEWLENSELSMREIANGTGFSNEQHLNRMFVRHTGMTPGEYRKNMIMNKRDYALGNGAFIPYNCGSQVSLDKLKDKGATFMFKQLRSKAMVAAALSLMMLLSACSGIPSSGENASSSPASSITSQTDGTKVVETEKGKVEVPANPQRIVVQYLMGDLVALGVTPLGITEVHKGAAFESKLTNSVFLTKWERFWP